MWVYLSTLDALNGLNCLILYVNTDYVNQGISTLFVKWILNDIFGLLCCSCNCFYMG